MVLYTLECYEILRHYFENHGNVVECMQKLRTDLDKLKHEKPKTVRISDNIAAVAESVCEAPSTLIPRRSQQLNIPETNFA